ncbi:hypothetical protein TWF694_001628 [Orbilia ellipsospora]|uniref:Uncharacterized protein n=1 Tax=Orbilia ellipsospora TaxID=2528407 RepID=A0AAV9X969_9PEZI
MSDTGSSSQTNATTTPTDGSSSSPSIPSSTTTPPPSSTDTPPPSTTTTPPTTSSPPPESTTTTPSPPPITTSSTTTTSIPSSSSQESSTEPSSTSLPPVTIVTVTPTSTPGDTTITVTTTSLNTDQTSPSNPIGSSPNSSSSSSSSTTSATVLPSTSGGGLSNPAKIAIAIIIPIFVVVLLAFLGIFLWRRYKKRKDSEEMRRKEVEEYGYNPNNDVSGAGGAMMGASSAASHGGDMTETDAGYRGWGNTAGGRKASAPMSAGVPSNATGPSYTSYQDGATNGRQYIAAPPPAQNELYGSPVSTGAVPAAAGLAALGVAHSDDDPKRNQDRHSHSPLLSSPTQRPSTADSSTIGAAGPTGLSELDDGLHRGDSVASSRYTNATRHSEGSDIPETTGNNAYMNYTVDGNDYYNDVANPYGGEFDYQEQGAEQGYQQPPPMIQQVGARRNTRIENPSDHQYAQISRQGNSGIAQNF